MPDNALYISKVAIHPYHLKCSLDGLALSRKCQRNSLVTMCKLKCLFSFQHAGRLRRLHRPPKFVGYNPQSDQHMRHQRQRSKLLPFTLRDRD